nr:hypothetical transcript [Hymenolepis microstoma]
MYETEIHLRDGGLGGVPEFPGWMAKILSIQSHYGLCFCLTGSVPSTPLKGGPSAIHTPSPATLQCRMSSQPQKITTTPLQSSAEALITMGLNVHKRFLSVPKVLPREKKAGSESIHNWEEGGPEEVGQNQPNVEYRPERSTREGDVELWLESWTKAVRSASTLSRLHVLHACLDACIQWEKSVANVRCRICRKKGDDDSLLLCDGCNAGFHLYCLRPSLHTIPEGDWFCVSCKPPPSRTKPTTSATSIRWRDRYARDEGSETSSGNEESVGGGDCESESASSDGDDGGRRRLRSKKAQSTRRTVSRSSSHSSIQTKTIVAKTHFFCIYRVSWKEDMRNEFNNYMFSCEEIAKPSSPVNLANNLATEIETFGTFHLLHSSMLLQAVRLDFVQCQTGVFTKSFNVVVEQEPTCLLAKSC